MRYIIIIFSLFNLSAFAQEVEEYYYKNLSMGINLGANFSKLRPDTGGFRYITLPAAGINFSAHLSESIRIRLNPQFSVMGTNSYTDKNKKLINYYLDLQLSGQFEVIEDLFFEIGVQPSILLNSRILRLEGGSISGTTQKTAEGFDHNIGFFTGLETPLSKSVSIGFRYTAPVISDFYNFHLYFNYWLFKGYFNTPEKE